MPPESLARYVANHDEQSVVTRRQNLEEIATDLSCRLINRIHNVARKGFALLWNDDLLDLAGSGHFRLQNRLFRAGLDMPPALADKNVHESRIAQTDGNNRRNAIKIQAAPKASLFRSASI